MFTRQRIISLVLSLLILTGGAVAFNVNKAKKESTVSSSPIEREIRTIQVASFPPKQVSNEIEIDGRLNAYEKINLAAEVQGKLLATGKTLRVGSTFSKGDLLFQVENKDDVFNLRAQRSSLFNLITQVMPDLKFDHPNEFEKWFRYLNAFDIEQNVQALPAITNQKEKYFIGGKNIFNQYYTIKSLEEKLNNYKVYAPFNGVFLSVNNYPGSLVSPGATLGQIMNTYNYELASPIAMDALKYISVGQKVNLYSEELGKNWTGKVNRISKTIDQTTQSLPVYITVSGAGLIDGMFLKGRLGGKDLQAVSVLPKDLIVNQSEVYVYQDSLVKSKVVNVISYVENEVYVKGIDPKDQVITSATNNLFVGQKVKL